MTFRNYQNSDYQLLCDFLIEVNKDSKEHINWNWARLEWMIGHPFYQEELSNLIGLWFDENHLVGVAIFDMYLGEASCITLPNYEYLFVEILEYAYTNIKDENGLGVAINDKNLKEAEIAKKLGFSISEQKEVIMELSLANELDPNLKDGFNFYDVDPKRDIDEIQWVIYQGFDHGNNREEFEKENTPLKERPHADPYLHLLIEDSKGKKVAFCTMWYDKRTDYAYLEPLCVIPECRKLGLGKSIVYQLCNRVRNMGAKRVFVISDSEFYQKLGFKKQETYTFYWKK